MAAKFEDYILYIAVIQQATSKNSKEVLASYSTANEDIDSVAIAAASDVPDCSSEYTLGFDEIILAFWREAAQPDIVYMLGCHAALKKERVWEVLHKTRDLLYHAFAGKNGLRRPLSPSAVAGKLKPKLRSLVQSYRGAIPPRQDLVIYKNAPEAYLVHKPDEEPPDGLAPPPDLTVARRKSLQEELADLGSDSDSEGEEETAAIAPGCSKVDTVAEKGFKIPEQVILQGKAHLALQERGPGMFSKPAANKAQWSTEIARSAVSKQPSEAGGQQQRAKDHQAPPKQPTWSMEYAERLKNGQNLDRIGEMSSSGESVMSAKGKHSKGTHHLMKWLQSREGSADPATLDVLSNLSSSEEVLPSSDQVPLRGQTPNSSDDYSKLGPMGRKRGLFPVSQELVNAAKVSPEERLNPSRESKTELYPSPGSKRFIPQRSGPVAGKIGDRAPSGLTWEEEIRRLHVARGLAPPRAFNPIGTEAEIGDEAVKQQQQQQQQPGRHPAPHPLPKPLLPYALSQNAMETGHVTARSSARALPGQNREKWKRPSHPPARPSSPQRRGCFCF